MPYLSKPIVVGAWVSWGIDLAFRDLLYQASNHKWRQTPGIQGDFVSGCAKAEFMISGGFGLKSAWRGLPVGDWHSCHVL